MENMESLEITTDFKKILEKTLSSEAQELFEIFVKVLSDNRKNNSREEKLIRALWKTTENRKLKWLLGIILKGLAGKIYCQDGLTSVHNIDHLKDELFVQSYELAKKRGGVGNIEYRAYIACWAAKKGVSLEGDFVECGVNKGTFSRTIINYVGFENLNKKFYLLDTFAGFDYRYVSEKERATVAHEERYNKRDIYEYVKETFQEFPNVEIIRGPVPDTLPRVKSDKVSYLSIDMNCTQPEMAAAEFFWDKLVSGAVIVLDDYAWPSHIEQRQAFNEFAKRKKVQVLALPTGQGLIFKP